MPGTERVRTYLNSARAADLLASWRASGLTLKAFAESHGLSEAKLTRWQRRVNAAAGSREITAAFVQVQPLTEGEITVLAQGVSIQVPASLIEQSLPAIVRAVRC